MCLYKIKDTIQYKTPLGKDVAFTLCLWAQSTWLMYHENKDVLFIIIHKMQRNQNAGKLCFDISCSLPLSWVSLWAGPKLNLNNILCLFLSNNI